MSRGALGRGLLLAGVVAGWPALARASATFVIQNLDDGRGRVQRPDAGGAGRRKHRHDPRAAAAQRLQQATSIWGTMIDSNVPIVIAAEFSPLACNATSITLGQAGAASLEDRPARAAAQHLRSGAAGRSPGGLRHQPGAGGHRRRVQRRAPELQPAACRTGITGSTASRPANDIDLLSVLLHEFGHGLGFVERSRQLHGRVARRARRRLHGASLRQPGQHALVGHDRPRSAPTSTPERPAPGLARGQRRQDGADRAGQGRPAPHPLPGSERLCGRARRGELRPVALGGQRAGTDRRGQRGRRSARAHPRRTRARSSCFKGGNCAARSGLANIAETAGAMAVLISDPGGVAPPSSIEVPPTRARCFPSTSRSSA